MATANREPEKGHVDWTDHEAQSDKQLRTQASALQSVLTEQQTAGLWGKSVRYAMAGAISVFSRTRDQNWNQWKSSENPLAKLTLTEGMPEPQWTVVKHLILYKRGDDISNRRPGSQWGETAILYFTRKYPYLPIIIWKWFCWKQSQRNEHCLVLKVFWEKNNIEKWMLLESWSDFTSSSMKLQERHVCFHVSHYINTLEVFGSDTNTNSEACSICHTRTI